MIELFIWKNLIWICAAVQIIYHWGEPHGF